VFIGLVYIHSDRNVIPFGPFAYTGDRDEYNSTKKASLLGWCPKFCLQRPISTGNPQILCSFFYIPTVCLLWGERIIICTGRSVGICSLWWTVYQ